MRRPVSSCTASVSLGAALWLAMTTGSFARSDLAFLDNAIHGDNSEVLLGQLAVTHASRSDVKSFAQTLVEDHSKARTEASGLVQQMGMIASPAANSAAAEEGEALRQMKGEAFDNEFLRYMIADHKKDIEVFRREASDGRGPAKELAERELPTLQKHLDAAERLASR
jgi:putative membrane protein